MMPITAFRDPAIATETARVLLVYASLVQACGGRALAVRMVRRATALLERGADLRRAIS